MKETKLSGDGIMCKEQKQSNEKVMTKKNKKYYLLEEQLSQQLQLLD